MKNISRLIVASILMAMSGALLSWLAWYQQVIYFPHAVRAESTVIDWIMLVGGSVLWVIMVLANVLCCLKTRFSRLQKLLYLTVVIVVVLAGFIWSRNSFLDEPLQLLLGYAMMLIPAIYFALVQKDNYENQTDVD